ncbi:MAG: DNA repair protein RecN [Treponema sp.]|nr:DNA repair protein RecN [Treponema sp.]
MLEELSIRNYALIDSLSISFENGLNILTGETGAGKSIIVGSLSFLLGGKADADVIRTGCDEAGVSAVISLAESNADVLEWLANHDLNAEDNTIVVRRNIKTSGRSAIYVQNVPVTRNNLAELMGLLFDLHGQHDHESLMRKDMHRRCLDRFAGIEGIVTLFHELFTSLAEKKKALELSLNSERNREERIELLTYAVDEIIKAAPKAGESRELEAEAQRLVSFEKLSRETGNVTSFLFDGEASVLNLARKARNSLETASSMDESLLSFCKRMDDLYFEAEDLSEELRSYRDGLLYEPGRLEEVEDRLGLLFRLKKKYGRPEGAGKSTGTGETPASEDIDKEMSDEEAILAYKARAEQEIEALSQSEENREKLAAEISTLEKTMAVKAAELSENRTKAAQKLGEQINNILKRLGMPNAQFAVNIVSKGKGPGGNLICGPWGSDDVEFLFSANAGEPLKELARIASGGELSRVMLAIKAVLAESDAIETLVFDEIDAGIGGEVALAVGEYLKKMGAIKQIFCITHLASIAVRADNHILVEKGNTAGRTQTTVHMLSGKGRREEIARMLAGDSVGSAALAHADDLLSKYSKGS